WREIVGEAVRSVQLPRLALDLAPLPAVKRGKSGIARKVALDFCQIQVSRERQRGAIDILAANNEHGVGKTGACDRLFERVRDRAVRGGKISTTRKDDVLPARQWLTDRMPSSAAHDDGVTHRQHAEALHIIGQAPRQAVMGTDDTVLRNGGDQCNLWRSPRRAWRGGRGWCIVHAGSLAHTRLVRIIAAVIELPCTTRVHSSNLSCSVSCWSA